MITKAALGRPDPTAMTRGKMVAGLTMTTADVPAPRHLSFWREAVWQAHDQDGSAAARAETGSRLAPPRGHADV